MAPFIVSKNAGSKHRAKISIMDDTVDFIVIGVGTAGSVLTSRLSENPNWTVLGLDKGPEAPQPFLPGFDTPSNYAWRSPHDPAYFSEPQSACGNRLMYVSRYEGIGGTSQIYGSTARKPSADILNKYWPDGWKYKDLERYLIDLEDHYCYYDDEKFTGISKSDCQRYHGKGGPVQLNMPAPESFLNFTKDYIQACSDKFGWTFDYNGDQNRRSGCTMFQKFRYRNGNRSDRFAPQVRVSGPSAYLSNDVLNRSNLLIKAGAPVLKILFDENKKAIGVIYLDQSQSMTRRIMARKEIILTSGAYASPQLLQVSGIGDPALLSRVKVPLVAKNSAVGQHMIEHQSVTVVFDTNGNVVFPYTSRHAFEQSKKDNPLYLSVSGGYPIAAHYNSGYQKLKMDDIQIYLWEGLRIEQTTTEIDTGKTPAFTGRGGASFLIVHQFPDSRGSINITSNSIFDKPQIDYGFTAPLSQYDTSVLKRALSDVRDMMRRTKWGNKYISAEIIPEPDQDADTFIIEQLHPAFHATSTCRIGDCVNSDLNVMGVSNLRVADASVFPTNIDGNPVYTILAVAEKAADMIKSSHK